MKKPFRHVGAKASLVAVVAAIAAIVATTAGSAVSASSTRSSSKGHVTLTYAMWDQDSKAAEQKVIAAFEKANPNISVKIELTPWDQYWQKLQAATTGGTTADVFWMETRNFPLYASSRILLPLSKLIASSKLNMKNFSKPVVASVQYKGVQYTIPRDDNLIGLWYNKKLFDAAGVSYPTANWTWDDVKAAAAKLTDPAKGIYGIAAAPYPQFTYYDTIFQAGGRVLSPNGKSAAINTPEGAAGLKFWADLVQSGSSPSMQQMTDTSPTEAFLSGKIAMDYLGNWMVASLSQGQVGKDIDVQVLPRGTRRATTELGLSYGIYAKSKHVAEAWKFLKFMAGPQASLIRAKMGIPTAYKPALGAWVKSFPQYNLKAYLSELAYGISYPVSLNTAAWENAEAPIISKVWSGDETAAQGAKDLSGLINSDLKKEGH